MPVDPLLIPFETTLAGERVTLHAWREEDAAALQAAVASSRDHRRPWMHLADQHQTVEETRVWIVRSAARWLLREGMNFGIWSPDGERLYGSIGIYPDRWDIPAFEISYWLRAGAEGHGYITEAAGLLTDYLLVQQGAQRVQIRCDARNTRSAAVPRRLGYALEGTLRHAERALDGTLETTLIFARIPGAPDS
jgi:ribosomal-protein-serine acetyltransferase